MLIVTLAKIVPDLEKMAFDPDTKAMRRAGADLYLNPFDARAALVAPTLARPGDSSLIVAMGPPDARRPMVEALAQGSDRALLLSDRALAGSDTLVTSRVLAAALRPMAPDIVLTGRWSTDSSTGQVPSQLAELLGLPVVNAARRIERRETGTLEVVGETEEGWSRYEVATPCLITIGEKIVKMKFPKPEALKEAEGKPFEVRGISDLGLAPGEVGFAGSPTLVQALRNEEPARAKLVFDGGPVLGRVREAGERIRDLLTRSRALPAPCRLPPIAPQDRGEVLVFAARPEGGLDPEALPLLSEVLRLPEPLYPSAVGFGPLTDEDRRRLVQGGAVRAYWSSGDAEWRSPEAMVSMVCELLRKQKQASGVLFLSTTWARELAGRVSGRMALGLTGDAVTLSWDSAAGLVFGKPSFGGGLVAQVVSKRRPSLATIRAGSFSLGELDRNASDLNQVALTPSEVPPRLRRIQSGVERDPRYGDLNSARVVVGIGVGIGGPDQVSQILETIRPLGAALGASRKVVDSGWVPPQLQVGLTGKSIAPELYIGVGVSGQVNHLVGVKRARVTVGINPKVTEPVFSRVDVGVVGDWREVLGPLVKELSGPHQKSLQGPES
jgi:electron transfer flavoprotein alpha subunit